MLEFNNLVAVITGGASGIGAATAALLKERGASIAVLDSNVENVAAEIFSVSCDITDSSQVDGAIQSVADHFGGIDIVINNAGIGAAGDIAANDIGEWIRVLDVNVIGLARVTRASLPYLRKSEHATIVNTCSVVAIIGVPNRALYSASKGAVAAVTLAMAADHVNEGIRVNAVTPGTADTPWVDRLLRDADNPSSAAIALRNRQPMGRLVTAMEVAHAIAYLASPRSSSTTGTLLSVDGGMSGFRL